MVLAAWGVERTAASARVFRERLPRLAGVLQDVHHRRGVEVGAVSITAYAQGAPPEDRAVVRLGGIRDARPTFGERIQVCGLGHVGGGSVRLIESRALRPADDELVDVA